MIKKLVKQDRTVFIIITVLFVSVFLLYFLSNYLIINEFSALEQTQNKKNINKIISTTENAVKDLKKIVIDYAHWNDTYKFVQDLNSEYIEYNFPEDGQTLSNLEINFFLISDLKRDAVFINVFDTEKEKIRLLYIRKIRERIQENKDSFAGIIKINDENWFVIIEPIMTSDAMGPIKGHLVGGKKLDEKFLKTASSELFSDARFSSLSRMKETSNVDINISSLKIEHTLVLEDEHLKNYLFFLEKEESIFSLLLENKRDIYLHGKGTTQYFILILFLLFIPLVYIYVKYQELIKNSLKNRLLNEIEKNRQKDNMIKIKERLAQAQHVAHIGNFEFYLDRHEVWVSDEVYNILKITKTRKLKGLRHYAKYIYKDDRHNFFNTLRKSACEHLTFDFTYRIQSPLDAVRILQQTGTVVYEDDIPIKFVGTLQDITEKSQYEEMIHSLAYYDSLTHLPNRALFKERLEKAISRASRLKGKLAVMYLDLDNFKIINDSMGHDMGDKTLQKLAKKITACIRTEDTLSRIGGDEFIILLEDITGKDEAIYTAQRIQETCSQPLLIDDKEIYASFSVGICIYPDNGEDMQTLIKNADTAMYHVKSNHKDNFHLFSDDLSLEGSNRVLMEGELHHAIEKNELYVMYQPKIDIQTEKIYGMEALVRWNSEKFGRVRPDIFIPIAEECGMISTIGEWVLKEALTQNEIWNKQGHELILSVNVSGHQLRHDGFYERIMKIIHSVPLDKSFLELEITESILMHNIHDSLNKLHLLKKQGIALSIDDFGTGYSSMSYLKRFPIDTLKIDKSFVDDLSTKNEDKEIVSAIVSLGHALHLKVVAEGVESKSQADLLKELGCDSIQGYLYSEPLEEKQFSKYLQKT